MSSSLQSEYFQRPSRPKLRATGENVTISGKEGPRPAGSVTGRPWKWLEQLPVEQLWSFCVHALCTRLMRRSACILRYLRSGEDSFQDQGWRIRSVYLFYFLKDTFVGLR